MDQSRDTGRFHAWADHFQAHPTAPVRRILSGSVEQAVVAWQVEPGQRIEAHRHPAGQDTWIVLEGEGLYQSDAEGTRTPVRAGQVVIAPPGAVHGLENTGTVPFKFLSVVSPAEAGFEPLAAT
jgi:quercetin dioxygenase-like cupin family protein